LRFSLMRGTDKKPLIMLEDAENDFLWRGIIVK